MISMSFSVPSEAGCGWVRRLAARVSAHAPTGFCVAVVETMFAGTPLGIYQDAIIGSRVFINPHSGRFLLSGARPLWTSRKRKITSARAALLRSARLVPVRRCLGLRKMSAPGKEDTM